MDYKEYTKKELIIETRHRFLTTLKGVYWDHFEEGFCSANTVLLLLDSADRALDHEDRPMGDWKYIKQYFASDHVSYIYGHMSRIWVVGRLFKKLLLKKLTFEYDVVVNYVEANEKVIDLISEMLGNEEIGDFIIDECKVQLENAEQFLYYKIEDSYPEIAKAIQFRRAGHGLIHNLFHLTNLMLKRG